MNATQQTVLDALKTNGEMTHDEILMETGLPYSSIKRTTQELRAAGLIGRRQLGATERVGARRGIRTVFEATVTETGQSPEPASTDNATV